MEPRDGAIPGILRGLARDARRLLRDGGSSAEFAGLTDRIAALSARVGGPEPTPLTRWLDNLRGHLDPRHAEGRGRTSSSRPATGGPIGPGRVVGPFVGIGMDCRN